MATQFLITTWPAVRGERTVTGTYRCAPESASSRSRYAPGGQSSVGTSADGSQSARTVLVEPTTLAPFCR